MPFSKDVRTRALVAAARHCCVCHKSKGLKVEVHHIVSQASGGSDDFDNAICLCFDCHADAGHYNSKHPKGTRISPQELRLARETWYQLVRDNDIQPGASSDDLYFRYLICRNSDVADEILRGNFSRLPIQKPFLASNSVGAFHSQISSRYSSYGRSEKVWGKEFTDKKEFERVHPDAQIRDRSEEPYYPYFESFRNPTRSEISENVASEDFVSHLLLNSDLESQDICVALGYREQCGGDHYQEIYRVRPIWFVYFEIQNLSEFAINIESLSCLFHDCPPSTVKHFSEYADSGKPAKLAFARPQLLSGQSILVPIATFLGPINMKLPPPLHSVDNRFENALLHAVSHYDLNEISAQVAVLGPSYFPANANISNGLSPAVHELDLTNVYIVDRSWEMGSCPHVFWVRTDSSVFYGGEVLAYLPNSVQEDRLVVPEGVDMMRVVELESEITHIDSICVDGEPVISGVQLNQWQYLELAVSPGDDIAVRGYYCPNYLSSNTTQDPLTRNSLVYHYLKSDHRFTISNMESG